MAESAVKDAKDAVRTNLACVLRRFAQKFLGGHSVLTRLVEYSVAMVDRSRWQDSLRAAQGAKMRDGIFFGVSDQSDELHVGTERDAQGSNSRGHRTS